MSLDEAFARVISEKEAQLLRPAASQLAAAAKDYGYIVIYAFPGLDPLLAAATAFKVLRGFGAEVAVYASPRPPRSLEDPSLLLGYPVALAQEMRASKPSALIGYGERPQGILPLAVASLSDSSTAGLTAAVLSEITVVGGFSVYSIVAALWLGLDTGKKGELQGIEASLLEVLRLENLVEEHFSLRLARWLLVPTERALAYTVLPHLPGVTGSLEAAERLLAGDPRLEPLRGKTLEEAPDEATAVLGEKLYSMLKEASRIPRRPTEVIGVNYYSRRSPLPDLREAAAILACGLSRRGPGLALALAVNERLAAASAHALYRSAFTRHASYIEEVRASKPQLHRVGRLQYVTLPEAPCPLLAEHELRRLGVVPPEAVAAFQQSSGELVIALESVARTAGHAALESMIERGCIEPLEDSVVAVLRPARC